MRILKGDWHRSRAVRMIGVLFGAAVFFLVGFLAWPDETTDPTLPTHWVILDRTPLNVRLVTSESGTEASLDIDPYTVEPFRLWHRPHDTTESYQTTFLAPPRLISKFGLPHDDGVDGPSTGAVWLSALLPNLALRTSENHHLFEREHADRLDITIAYIQRLGRIPDRWHRQFVTCEKTSVPHFESVYPGLTVNATRTDMGYLHLIGCQPADALPDGNPPLIVCRRDIYSSELAACRVEFVIPWLNFSEEIQRQRPRHQMAGHPMDYGIFAVFKFPASYLPQWRRLRDLSLCLIEAVVVDINKIGAPARNPETCGRLKSALWEGQAVLAPSSGDGS